VAKSNGLGDRLFVAGVNISNDVPSIEAMHVSIATQDVTGIDKSAVERLGLVRDGNIDFSTFLNDASGQQHLTLRGLPSTDVHTMYLRGTTLGNPGVCLIGKQVDYKASRPADGSMGFTIPMLANGYGIEMDGHQLTAGLRTDTGATNGTGVEGATAGSTLFGWSAYLQVTAFSGTDCTISIQDATTEPTYSALSGASFTQLAAGNPAPFCQRLQSSSATATVRRFVRVITATTGGFSSVSFVVVFIRPLELRSF
jgi:hypothetical protein